MPFIFPRLFDHNFTLFSGTGKSVTGAHIAYIFAMHNRNNCRHGTKNADRHFVLYCGPSNKSVDVVFGKRFKLQHT